MNAVQMTPAPQREPGWMRALHWTPRALGILFALFVSIFALDVFGAGYDLWGTVVALAMHMILPVALLLAVALAWRWPWVGAILYIGFGVWYMATAWGRFDWTTPVLIGGAPIAVGLLFLADWWLRRTPG